MKVLLIGAQAEALEFYRRVLTEHGIDASVGGFDSPFNQYDAIVHLWPINASRLSGQLAVEKKMAAGRHGQKYLH